MRTKVGYFFMLTKQEYEKPALDLEAQLDFLQSYNLSIPNLLQAKQRLETVSLHRFSNYFISFYDASGCKFKHGVQFEDIWALYNFDKALRLLVLDAIEEIEVAFRASMTNVMSVQYEPHWFVQASLFKNRKYHHDFMQLVYETCNKSGEPAIKNYYKYYNHPDLPPAWVIIETISLGACSKLYKNIRQLKDKKQIAAIFNKHPTVVDSWMEALTYTRNICAHHARLWNRWFVDEPLAVQKTPLNGKTFWQQSYVIKALLAAINSESSWPNRFWQLLENNPFVPFEKMGFIANWRADLFWEEKERYGFN